MKTYEQAASKDKRRVDEQGRVSWRRYRKVDGNTVCIVLDKNKNKVVTMWIVY